MHRPSLKNSFYLGFIGETPSMPNQLRHLVLLEDGTGAYTETGDRLHLCLSQDFERTINAIESKCLRENLEHIFVSDSVPQTSFRLHQHVRVKKFDDKYHNAQIVDLDGSLIKVKFYQRQAQTEIWMHQQSLFIDATSQKEPKRKYEELESGKWELREPTQSKCFASVSFTITYTDRGVHWLSISSLFTVLCPRRWGKLQSKLYHTKSICITIHVRFVEHFDACTSFAS